MTIENNKLETKIKLKIVPEMKIIGTIIVKKNCLRFEKK